ncbi:hypothetical protein [Candidiatus Paracoxiella cheracis]|uniref:hypothetical protein n=1 Tax=Candidiatus Paracoxiella cheracis TaxID=3405120 RepID=UPI003BF47742
MPLFNTLAAHLKGETSSVSGECLSAVLNILSDNPSGEQDYQLLLNVIYRIAQYAVSVTVLPMPLLNLFQHKHFRLLFQDALHDYWCDNTFILDKNILQTFDGRARTHAFLEQLKTTLINQSTNINDGLKNLVL